MSQHDPANSLRDMLAYALKAMAFCANKSQEEFNQDELLQLGVTRVVELIGEAASRIPLNLRSLHPEIPWQEIIATRNRLIHGYDRVDLQIVWDTIETDLPPLVDSLRRALGDS